MNMQRRAYLAARMERWTEIPMLVLSLIVIPLLVVPLTVDLSEPAAIGIIIANWVIWTAFAGELVTKTYLAPDRKRYLVRHWYDIIIVIVPFLRPLRLLRVLRVLTLFIRAERQSQLFFGGHGLWQSVIVAVLFVFTGAAIVAIVEEDSSGTITDFWSSLWWATATITTVGYGDATPISTTGRILGAGLMLLGIGFFGIVTANIAAYFVKSDQGKTSKSDGEILAQLQRLELQIADLRGALTEAGATGSQASTGSRAAAEPGAG